MNRSDDAGAGSARFSRRSTLASIALLPLVSQAGCGSDDQNGAATPPPEPTLEERYEAALDAFINAFNRKDVDAALAFFSESAVLTVNANRVLTGQEAIRGFLVEYGASAEGGALSRARLADEGSYFTGDGIFLFARISFAKRTEISGFAVTPFTYPIDVAMMSKLDGDARCVECEVILNWGALLPSPIF